MSQMELAYVGLTVRDRRGFEEVLENVIGLARGSCSDSDSAWRNDGKVRRLILHDGEIDDITYFAVEVRPEEFDSLARHLRRLGLEVWPATPGQAQERGVRDLLNVMTPFGIPLEVVHGFATQEIPVTPLVPKGFRTAGEGLGHLVFRSENLEAADTFLREGLGFVQTDWLELGGPGASVVVRFYHCNSRHHTIAVAGRSSPQGQSRLDHIMFEAHEVEDVRAAYANARAQGATMARAIGQHENDHVESFYAATPSGINVELGAGGRTVTDPWEFDRAYARISLWGHEPDSDSTP